MNIEQTSPQGRRILVAPVTGELGERIQAWRSQYDPQQARRLPPHLTLCYWVPIVDAEILGRQVLHAFPNAVTARLGQMQTFDNPNRTFFIELHETDALDNARNLLYDAEHLELPIRPDWTWHITCVRNSLGRPDIDAIRAAAADFKLDEPWSIDTVTCMELHGERYETIADWQLTKEGALT